MRATWRWRLASCVLIGLWWAIGCGDDGESTDELAGRMFLLDASEGFEPVAGTTVRLSFRDETLDMYAGCNTHSGDYSMQDDVLIVESIGSTEIGCDPSLHEQDTVLVKFLTSKPRLQLDGDRLTLSNAKITLVFLDREVADPDRPLVGTVWEVDTFIDGDSASNLPLATKPTIVFAETGKLKVDTTCNTGDGRYTVDDEQVVLSDVSYTEVACGGPSKAADMGMQAVLRDGTLTFEVDGPRLMLEHGDVGVAALARD